RPDTLARPLRRTHLDERLDVIRRAAARLLLLERSDPDDVVRGDDGKAPTGDEEREPRAADAGEPAREQAPDRLQAAEDKEVEAEDAASKRVGGAQLEHRLARRRPEREREPDDGEQGGRSPRRLRQREREQARAEPDQAGQRPPPARARRGRGDERAGERAEPEAREEDPERVRPGVEGLAGEHRDQDTDVEADEPDHGRRADDQAEGPAPPYVAEALADRSQAARRLTAAVDRVQLPWPHERQPHEHGEEPSRVQREALADKRH